MTTLERDIIAAAAEINPAAVDLACFASFAVRVDPKLLRDLRQELMPTEPPSLEADVWLGPLVNFRGPDGVVFHAGVGAALRERLSRDKDRFRRDWNIADAYERAWKVTKRSHEWLAPTLGAEEELNYLEFTRTSGAPTRARDILRSALATLVDPSQPGIAHWAAGAATRMPARWGLNLSEGRAMAVAATSRLKGGLVNRTLPPRTTPEEAAWASGAGEESRSMVVRMYPGAVEFTHWPEQVDLLGGVDADTIPVPPTTPVVLDVGVLKPDAPASTLPNVEISYSSDDPKVAEFVDRLSNELARASCRVSIGNVYHDGSKTFLRPGFLSPYAVAGRERDALIVVMSEGWMKSSWTGDEFRAFMVEGRKSYKQVIVVHRGDPDWTERREQTWKELDLQFVDDLIPSETSDDAAVRQVVSPCAPTAAVKNALLDWQRVELNPTRPQRVRIDPLARSVRVRTMNGAEFEIGPARPEELFRLPVPTETDSVHVEQFQKAREAVLSGGSNGPCRLLVVTGPAGVGKTHFALTLANSFGGEDYGDGRFYFERRFTRGVKTPQNLARLLVRAVDPKIEEPGPSGWVETYRDARGGKNLVIVVEDVDPVAEWLANEDVWRSVRALSPQGSLLVLTAKSVPVSLFSPNVDLVSEEELAKRSFFSNTSGSSAVVLGPLSESYAMELLAQRVSGPETFLRDLARACACLPGPLFAAREIAVRAPAEDVRKLPRAIESARRLGVFQGDGTFTADAARTVLGEDLWRVFEPGFQGDGSSLEQENPRPRADREERQRQEERRSDKPNRGENEGEFLA